ncbi:MAG: hypothetical protein EPN93_13590 [Spirochaetes bacterium]|nr:MAG: hypothetical protein EPN93_13590 [Spirochaetota bacterium]
MFNKIKVRILNKYENVSGILYRKASILLMANFVIIVSVLILPPLVYSLRGILLWVLLISLMAIAGMVLSIILIRIGYYYIAANVTSLTSLIVSCCGVIYQQYQMDPVKIGYSSMMYIIPISVVYTSLFCTRRWTTLIMVVSLMLDFSYFRYLRVTGAIDHLTLSAGFIDSIFAILLAYGISMLIDKMNKDAMGDIKRELEKNTRQYTQIKKLHESITDTSVILAKTSEELSAMAMNFSSTAMSQFASAEEISSSVEQMKSNMNVVAVDSGSQYLSLEALIERINTLSSSILTMKTIIEKASNASDETSQQTKSGESILDEMNKTMAVIIESSRQMIMIVDVINEIADKISLLSLNATIEAARAKESGRGFAVVANEISKLSTITSNSLREITSLIQKTESEVTVGMNNVKTIVEVMRITITNVNSINEWMSRINEEMAIQVSMNHEVNDQATNVRKISAEIRLSANEQEQGLAEVAQNVTSMTSLNQSFSESAMRLAGATEEIATIAEKLKTQLTAC